MYRIFVVDDETTIAQTTSQILQLAGFEATPFSDPRLLLESCHNTPPDLVISDIIMPQMDGLELAASLWKMLPQCRVILFTGQAGVTDLREFALEHGFEIEVWAKPLHPTKLIARVRGIVNERNRVVD